MHIFKPINPGSVCNFPFRPRNRCSLLLYAVSVPACTGTKGSRFANECFMSKPFIIDVETIKQNTGKQWTVAASANATRFASSSNWMRESTLFHTSPPALAVVQSAFFENPVACLPQSGLAQCNSSRETIGSVSRVNIINYRSDQPAFSDRSWGTHCLSSLENILIFAHAMNAELHVCIVVLQWCWIMSGTTAGVIHLYMPQPLSGL